MDVDPNPIPAAAPFEPAVAAKNAREAMDAIRALFDTLVPPETVEIVDVYGNRYKLRARLSARSQIVVMQSFDRIATTEAGEAAKSAFAGLRGGGVQAAVLGLVRASANEAVLGAISAAFEAAQPGPVAKAREAAKSAGDVAKDAADLFSVEEMVAALVPFFLGALRRLVGLFGEMLQPAAAEN